MDVDIKSHLERDVQTICGYCGKEFRIDEVYVERDIHGRTWRFCNEECYKNFVDAVDYAEPDAEDAPTAVLHGEEE